MLPFISLQLLSDSCWKDYITADAEKAKTMLDACTTKHADLSVSQLLKQSILEGIEQEKVEVEQIIHNPEAPSFSNTIVALNRTGEMLSRADEVLSNLLSAETSDELETLAEEMFPIIVEHGNNIMLNESLFERVRAVYLNPPAGLMPEDLMLLQKTYEGFERSGATLDKVGKQRFREITARLSELTLRFSQNLLKETNAFILHLTNEDDLAGIPPIHREAAAHEARERELDGWVFTLHAPSFVPFMTYADNRGLREKMYRAYHTRCTHDNAFNNFEIVRQLVNLRTEKARLLGYETHADYVLKRRMAEKVDNVYELLDNLIDKYLPKAKEEVAAIEKRARKSEGTDFKMMPWDFSYYSQKLKKEQYDYDPDMLRPYFELASVKKGVFGLAQRLYGIRFEFDASMPMYHKDVEAYRVYDSDGAFLAVLYLDFFPRATKKGGAWMTNFRSEHSEVSTDLEVTAFNSFRPVVSVTTNFTKPTAEKPSLLTLDEVQTFLHEFGHALHGIFAMTHYEALSGTSVYWDFVELPSQFLENYSLEPEFLTTFAHHYQTGEPIPSEYLDRIKEARNFQAAYACMRQVSFGLLDMAFYTLSAPLTDGIVAFEDKAWKRVQMLNSIPEACMSVQFSHIMSGGYSAGYYSYKWAEVLDADAFACFKEEGIFNVITARRFRDCILSQGGVEMPMRLYERFRGQKPSICALLERDGVV